MRKRQINENIGLIGRRFLSAELYVRYHLAIVSGKDARLVLDDEGIAVAVAWDDRGGIVPNLEQRNRSLECVANRAWGMPAQTHVVDQAVSLEMAQLTASLDLNQLPPGLLAQIVRTYRDKALTDADKTSTLPKASRKALGRVEVSKSESESAIEQELQAIDVPTNDD